MQPLDVVLFGGFALRRGGDAVPPIPSRVGRSLFAYLVVNRGVPQARERLVAEFWPELSESRGRRRLSHTLWQLQDALAELPDGSSYLEARSDTLCFAAAASVRVDTDEFERGLDELRHLRAEGSVQAGDLLRLEQVVELYRGEFLDGHYEPWVLDEQERLGQRYLEALGILVAMARQQGSYEDALLYARRLTNQAPLREDGHREVMRLSMLLGRPAEALRQFERCREVLAEELGSDPSPTTTQLYQRILRQGRGSIEPAEPSSSQPPPPAGTTLFPDRPALVGRERERTAALGVLDAALAGRGGAVLIEGDAGLGKTRMLEEVVDDAGWRGFVVASASCRSTGSPGPFEAVRALLEDLVTPLRIEHLRHRVEQVWIAQAARLVPALQRAVGDSPPVLELDRGDGAQRMRDSVVRVLLALTEVDPLLVVLDDVQWIDDDSLAVLTALAAELARYRCALLISYRGEEARRRPAVWGAVQRIDREVRPVRLVLGPLDAFSISELGRSVARGQPMEHAAVARLQRETGGNPLFVVETLRELLERGNLDALGEDGAPLPLPGSIRELVLTRLARLPNEVRSVLDVAAIAGDRADLDTLAAAVELPRATVVEAVDVLVRRSLLREVDDSYGLHHDQIRRTSLEALSDEAERSLHRRVGQALEGSHPDEYERLAHHFEAAGVVRRAVSYLLAAGRRAASLHAYASADALYRRATAQQRRGPVSVAARFDLLLEHHQVLDVLGERDQQRQVIDELAGLAGDDRRRGVEVARLRALSAAESGEGAGAVELVDAALVDAERLADAALVGRTVRAAATVRTWMGRREEAAELWERASRAAATPGELAECKTMLASVLRELDRHDDAARHLDEALQVAEEAGELREQARALGVLGSVRMETGDSGQAVELYRSSLERCRSLGFRRGERINLVNLGNVLYTRGDVAGALDAYEQAAVIALALDDAGGHAVIRLNAGFVRHAVLGDDATARRDLNAALRHYREVGDHRFEANTRGALAAIALRTGALSDARSQLRAAEAVADTRDGLVAVHLRPRQAELALATGDAQAAVEHAQAALDAVENHHLDDLLPGVLTLLARALLAAGDEQAADEISERAVRTVRGGSERPYLVHLGRHDVLTALGRTAQAHQHAQTGAGLLIEILDTLEPEVRAVAASIDEHARLLSAAGANAPRRMTVLVAEEGAPSGRPLRAAEKVEVRLELLLHEAPQDPVDRRRWLLGSVVEQVQQQGGAATVADLAGILEVSEATVRRDLAALRDQGHKVATRGARAG